MLVLHVHIELTLSYKILWTQGPFEGFLDGVRQEMPGEYVRSAELFTTNVARVWSDMQVRYQVFAQIVGLLEAFTTNIANTGFLASVDAGVSVHVAQFHEGFAAEIALVFLRGLFDLPQDVDGDVFLVFLFLPETLVAFFTYVWFLT